MFKGGHVIWIGNQLKRERDFNLAIATYLKGTGLLQDTAKRKEMLESFMIGVCSWHVREFDIIKYNNSLFTLGALGVFYFHSKREPTPTHVPLLNGWMTQKWSTCAEKAMERCPWVPNLQPQLIASSIYIYIHIEFGVLNHWLFSPLLKTLGRWHFWLIFCRCVKTKQLATVILRMISRHWQISTASSGIFFWRMFFHGSFGQDVWM